MALSTVALVALLASGDAKLPAVITADQVQQPHGAAPVMLLATTAPATNSTQAPANQLQKKADIKKGKKKSAVPKKL
jgi:hypothetical protein